MQTTRARMKARKLVFALILVVITSTFSGGCGKRANMGSSLKEEIAALKSGDFLEVRWAQREILANGSVALGELFTTARESNDAQQVGLCSYLIGEIDKETYKRVLTELTVPSRICLILRYPNNPAVKSLAADDRKQIAAHFENIRNMITKDERTCIEAVMPALKDD